MSSVVDGALDSISNAMNDDSDYELDSISSTTMNETNDDSDDDELDSMLNEMVWLGATIQAAGMVALNLLEDESDEEEDKGGHGDSDDELDSTSNEMNVDNGDELDSIMNETTVRWVAMIQTAGVVALNLLADESSDEEEEEEGC